MLTTSKTLKSLKIKIRIVTVITLIPISSTRKRMRLKQSSVIVAKKEERLIQKISGLKTW